MDAHSFFHLVNGSLYELKTHGLDDQKFDLVFGDTGGLGNEVEGEVAVVFGEGEDQFDQSHDAHLLVQSIKIILK